MSDHIPEGMKRCSKCGEVKPATTQYFRRKYKREILRADCKKCESLDRHDYRNRIVQGVQSKKEKEPMPPQGYKKCRKCGEIKLLQMFFRSSASKDGHNGQCKLCCLEYRHTKSDVISQYLRDYRKTRFDEIREYARNINKTQKTRLQIKAYRSKHADRIRASNHKRRARLASIPGHFTYKYIAHITAIQQGHCCYCGRAGVKLTIEHIIPITREGTSNDPWNICLACRNCNSSKSNRLLEEWVDRWYFEEIQ